MKPQLTARLTKALKTEETDAINESNADDSNHEKTSVYSADCGSNDGMDIDMSDIVIIDEYDSTKNESKQEELEKKVGRILTNRSGCLNTNTVFHFGFFYVGIGSSR